MKKKTLSIATLLIIAISLVSLSIPVSAFPAENETPSKLTGVFFAPVFWEGSSLWPSVNEELTSFSSAMKNQGYEMTVYVTQTAGVNPTNATLVSFNHTVASGDYGVVFITTHGAEGGQLLVEEYKKTEEGKKARDAAYDRYVDPDGPYKFNPFAEVVKDADGTDGYGILITQTFISNRAKFAKSIVYVSACHSAADDFGATWTEKGARVMVGYPVVTQFPSDMAEKFWGNMDGTRNAGTKRPVGKAIEECNELKIGSGDPNTVLAPIVKGHGGSPVVFDCKMDTSIDPKEVVTAPPDEAILTNWQWVGDDTISFDVLPLKPLVHFTVHADKAISGNNGAKLDGNWVGPNGDDYVYEEHEGVGGGIEAIKGPYYTWYGAEYWIVMVYGRRPVRLISDYY